MGQNLALTETLGKPKDNGRSFYADAYVDAQTKQNWLMLDLGSQQQPLKLYMNTREFEPSIILTDCWEKGKCYNETYINNFNIHLSGSSKKIL